MSNIDKLKMELAHTQEQMLSQTETATDLGGLRTELQQTKAQVVVGAFRTQHNPASQCLHRSSVSRIGNAAAHGAASCEQSFFWKRSTDGGDRCEAAQRTIHVQHVKGARSQTRNSQTGITLQCTVYCNKEHFTSKHLFLIYRWESRGHRITGASTMEPSSVLVTPLGVTRAQ